VTQYSSTQVTTFACFGLAIGITAFGAYSAFTNVSRVSSLRAELAVAQTEFKQAQADSASLDVNGNYHRLTGDRVSSVFSTLLTREANRLGVRITKGTASTTTDPYNSIFKTPSPSPDWAQVGYEFDVAGDTRNIHKMLCNLAETGLPIEYRSIAYNRRIDEAGRTGITARVSVVLISRKGVSTKPEPAGQSGPQQPADGGGAQS